MTQSSDLTKLDSHFAFGENWAEYSRKIGSREIDEAIKGLVRLTGESLAGRRFLDIGCGSGLHSLAASRLGAAEIIAVDIDPESVATTRAVLSKFSQSQARVEQASVFELPRDLAEFDIVYSWGVLHHTGDIYKALEQAMSFVRPGGRFAFALYRKTWACGFWTREKKWYAGLTESSQKKVQKVYVRLLAVAMAVRGMSFREYVDNYQSSRGMDFYHDVHDWLGGYPYQSISPAEVENFMTRHGFRCEKDLSRKGGIFGRHVGLFGSGCDEYVYVRM